MAELEATLETRLIDQLCQGESQWRYRKDIKDEASLWANFKYILEQNNKDKLNGTALSASEFAQVKNQVSHSSFYDAGRWFAGEGGGQVYVHVQRGNEKLHLLVFNHEHIAGGNSVYEVINQYQVPGVGGVRDRRFDVSLLINGLPVIHIELKNKEHSYLDAFNQIKKYVGEGKFSGPFSNVQVFVVTNGVDTKYFAAARESELNKEFLTGWLDSHNQPVADFFDFTKAVLKIPAAHELVSKYTVLDKKKKQLLVLRPYQIHAIEAMRAASKKGASGFIWHTTGSGKTMTSYKATRNLLMDIPGIDKTIFLIDRKDLDSQTNAAFESYSENDTIDVDGTDNVSDLIKKLMGRERQMIVTTRQKMQTMINKRIAPDSREEKKLKNLRLAFVVDECHRAVTPQTKRDLERFFHNSLWFGFTGTPIFKENSYEQKGDLPQTTEQLYGKCLHAYTIKEAIHDKAVLGFMVETLGPKNEEEPDPEVYQSEAHMRAVLNVILNQSYGKLGLNKGRGRTYEAMLTVSSIQQAQAYYKLLRDVKQGKDELKISPEVHQALPDFPKFAITYSVSENEDISQLNQEKMTRSLEDYNAMFGTNFSLATIAAYNANLNDRLARKEKRYLNRSQQLDLVIVVDRLLTGFDAPCLSTLYIDRQPLAAQNLIQAFSRTNRLFDSQKKYGQIVTFQSPKAFKKAIDTAIALYSRGGSGQALAEDWDTVKEEFGKFVRAVRQLLPDPAAYKQLTDAEKVAFVSLFGKLDATFAHLRSFTNYNESVLAEFNFTQKEYEDYAAVYETIKAEIVDPKGGGEGPNGDGEQGAYELVGVNRIKVDYDYIVELLNNYVIAPTDNDLDDIKQAIATYAAANPKLGGLLKEVLAEILADVAKYQGQDLAVIINHKRQAKIDEAIAAFAAKWFVSFDDVKYQIYHYTAGDEVNNLKSSADYAAYASQPGATLKKFQFFRQLKDDFKHGLMPEVEPLL